MFQNVYAVYKMHVLSQNSRRKARVTRTALCTGQVIKKKVHRVSAQIYLRAMVQDGVLMMHSQLLFFAAKVQIWPLLSIHTLESVVPVKTKLRTERSKLSKARRIDADLNI